MSKKTTPSETPMQLRQVDPASLIVGANVRVDPKVDKKFIASIRERGVIEPIITYENADKQLVVIAGQRRTCAALEAGRASVPVVVQPEPEDADRIVDQVVENEHRESLTTADRIAAVDALGLHLSAAQIAKRTALPRADVDAARKIAASETATAAAQSAPGLDLMQLAVLAEFEGDEKATHELLRAARTGGFQHTAQRLRDDRERAQRHQEARQEAESAGVTMIDRPSWDNDTTSPLYRLSDSGGQEITDEGHRDCPGHAAYTVDAWQDVFADTGEAVPDDYEYASVDDDGPERVIENRRTVDLQYVCTDPEKYGHQDRWGSSRQAPRKLAADMTESERAQAKAERRDVIESNKAWDSAETVRREWLAQFLTRKTMPKGAHRFVGHIVMSRPALIADVGADRLLCSCLGIEEAMYGMSAELDKAVEKAPTEQRAAVLTLARVLASVEAATGRHSWRSVDQTTADYLSALAEWGYELSPVEDRARGIEPQADTK